MPLYQWECEKCGREFDKAYKIAECPTTVFCHCGGVAKKIITLGHGGIQRDEPVWLDDSVRGALQDLDSIKAGKERPIESRTDYNRFMRDNPRIQPLG